MNAKLRLWPAGLTGRVTLVLLFAIAVEFIGTVLVFGEAERLLVRSEQAHRIAEQLAVADRVLSSSPAEERARIANQLSTGHVAIGWSRDPGEITRTPQIEGAIAATFRRWEAVLGGRELRLGSVQEESGRHRLVGALAMTDGTWIRFASAEPINRWGTALENLVSLALVAAIVLAVAALLVRTLAAPLRALADAADQIGAAPQPIEVAESGPGELKRVAAALNAMQARIQGLLESRTRALVAVSHDLRTPIARLKLRLGNDGTTDIEAVRGDIEEMDDMLSSLLEFMRGGEMIGSFTRLNLASLVQTEVEREQDVGRPVTYQGADRLDVQGDPVALRRAFANLISNALKYGENARVTGRSEDGGIVIDVCDDGPGMSQSDLARATEPFFRADIARQRDTEGLGLGLAIVAQVVQFHQGEVTLTNAPQGGLCARIRLPAAA